MKLKKIISLVLVAMMVMSVFSTLTIASASSIVDKFEVIEYGIYDAEGNPAELDAGTTVYVKTTLKRVSDTNNSNEYTASVINAVYSSDDLVVVGSDTQVFPFYGTTKTFTSEIVIPAGKTDLQLKTLLWDGIGYETLKPLAVPSDEAIVSGLLINGKVVEDFNANGGTYDVEFAEIPTEVDVKAISNGIMAVNTTYENGIATVVADGITHTINCVKEELTLNATAVINGVETNFPIPFTYAKWTQDTNPESATYGKWYFGPKVESTYNDVFASNPPTALRHQTKYGNNATYFVVVNGPEELLGAKGLTWNSDTMGAKASDVTYTEASATVTIDRNATVYFSADPEVAEEMGATAMDDIKLYAGFNYGSQVPTLNVDDPTTLGTVYHEGRFFKLNLAVPEGQNTATFTIPLTFDKWIAPCLYIKPRSDSEPQPEPELAATAVINGVTTSFPNTFKYLKWTQDTNEESATFGKWFMGTRVGNDYATLITNGAVEQQTKIANNTSYLFPHSGPAEIEGAKQFKWNTATMGAKDTIATTPKTSATLTINKNATVYFTADPADAARLGATQMSDMMFYMGVIGASQVPGHNVDDPAAVGTLYHSGKLFKLELEVPAGQTSATFVIPLSFDGWIAPCLYVK